MRFERDASIVVLGFWATVSEAIDGAPAVAVLAVQIKVLDRRARNVAKKGTISAAELGEVRAKLRALLGL